jgi:hypothetical protein
MLARLKRTSLFLKIDNHITKKVLLLWFMIDYMDDVELETAVPFYIHGKKIHI